MKKDEQSVPLRPLNLILNQNEKIILNNLFCNDLRGIICTSFLWGQRRSEYGEIYFIG